MEVALPPSQMVITDRGQAHLRELMFHHSSPEPVPDQKRSCISKQYSITFTSDSSERYSQKHLITCLPFLVQFLIVGGHMPKPDIASQQHLGQSLREKPIHINQFDCTNMKWIVHKFGINQITFLEIDATTEPPHDVAYHHTYPCSCVTTFCWKICYPNRHYHLFTIVI